MLPLNKIAPLLTVFIIPLLGANANFGFEQSKVLFFIISLTLIGFLWMGKGIKWTLISKSAGLFILILLLTSLSGLDPRAGLLGNPPYFQGWILYAYLYLFFLMVRRTKINLKIWAMILVGSALLVSLSAIRDWVLLNILGTQVITYSGRVVSTFGQPNFYAGFLLLTLPFAYYLRPLGLAAGLISIAGIYVSYSRSAILLALLLVILGLTDQLKKKLNMAIFVFLAVSVTVILAFIFSSGFVGNEFSIPLKTNNPDLTSQSVEKRAYIWPQALKIIFQKPLLGYGLENISKAYSDYFERSKHLLFEVNSKTAPSLFFLKDLNLDRTHNYILDLFLFSGVIGVVVWLCLVGFLLIRVKHKVLLVCLLTYLIWIQFQNQSLVQLLYFWLIAGLIDQSI